MPSIATLSDPQNETCDTLKRETSPMWLTSVRQKITSSGTAPLILSALFLIVLHTATNGQYGFHRDELATIDDARYLDWGYVVYPPITPLIARLSLTLFGTSLIGLRFFAALAMGVAMVITGLMARDLGAQRPAQLLAAWAAAISPVAMTIRTLYQYVALDYLAWVLAAWFVIRLLNSADPRWWLAIGVAAGLGMMTKYTMAFFLTALFAALLITAPRKLLNRYFWCGALLAFLIFLPNFLWQIRHHFISLDFLQYIHARDIRVGRTDNFLLNQLWVSTQVITAPLWLAGLYYLFFTPAGKRYRMIGWMYLITLLLFFFAKGRDYYLSPAYPMLFAAGAAWSDQWLATLSPRAARIARRAAWRTVAIAGILTAPVVLPVAPAGSQWWKLADAVNSNFNEEFGWPQMADAVSRVRDSLPPDSAPVGILAGDAGEAAAINLYGRARGLPEVISGSNSHWLRGYGDPPPKTVIAAGFRRSNLDRVFESCDSAGRFQIPFGITNSAIGPNTEIFVCSHPRQPWNLFWPHFRGFG